MSSSSGAWTFSAVLHIRVIASSVELLSRTDQAFKSIEVATVGGNRYWGLVDNPESRLLYLPFWLAWAEQEVFTHAAYRREEGRTGPSDWGSSS